MIFYVISGAMLAHFSNMFLLFPSRPRVSFLLPFLIKTHWILDTLNIKKPCFYIAKSILFTKRSYTKKLTFEWFVNHLLSIIWKYWCHFRCFFGIDFCIDLFINFGSQNEPKTLKIDTKNGIKKDQKKCRSPPWSPKGPQDRFWHPFFHLLVHFRNASAPVWLLVSSFLAVFESLLACYGSFSPFGINLNTF